MKTYKCRYWNNIDGRKLEEEIQAESHQEAYEKFLNSKGTYDESVLVSSGTFDGGQFFRAHIKKTLAEAADAKRQEMHAAATEDAQASLSSTDMLLKQLIAEQKETNQWLRKIRWSLIGIFVIIMAWHLFGWRIIPIR